MRMICLEWRRVLKTRATWWLAAIAVLLCALMALLAISYTRYYYLDADGVERHLSGREAIAMRGEMLAPLAGDVTPEKIQAAFETYHEVYAQYGEDVPLEVEYARLYPINLLLNRVREVFVDPATGVPLATHEITPETAATYYERRTARLAEYMAYAYTDLPAATAYALTMDEGIQTPLTFRYGVGNSDAYEYLTVCILLLVMVCAAMTAPIFAAEYASGADDILRCARRGRTRLAAAKLGAALSLNAALFCACIALYLLIVCGAYGWESLATSLQLIRSSLCFAPLDAGAFQLAVAGAGLLTLLAVASFTLFLSARLRNPLAVLGIAAGVILLPTLISFGGLGSNLEGWLRLCLPSGGVGLRNSMYYELSGFTFLSIGQAAIWSPYVLVAAAAAHIPLFCALAIRAYNRHQTAR